MSKIRTSISIGENTEKFLREESDRLEITMSAFVTMLVKNYEKEQKALEVVNNMEMYKKMLEGLNEKN